MSKKTEKSDAVATVPGGVSYLIKDMPQYMPTGKGVRKLNLPQLVKMEQIPVGSIVRGKILKFIHNFTGKDELRGSMVMWLENGGAEFLFPVTGVIRKALELKEDGTQVYAGKAKDPEAAESFMKYWGGKTIFMKRLPDGNSAQYKKVMFLFDVVVQD